MDEKKLLKDYEPLITKIAYEYYKYSDSPSLELEDFIQDARIGFIVAVRKFDEKKGIAFASYIDYGIRLELRKTLNEKSHLVRFPKYRQEQLSRILKAEKRLGTNDKKSIMRETGLREKDIDAVLSMIIANNTFYLDDNVFDNEEKSFIDILEDDNSSLIDITLLDTLEKAIDRLPESEGYLVKSMSGSFGGERKKKKDLSLEFGMSSKDLNRDYRIALNNLKKAI